MRYSIYTWFKFMIIVAVASMSGCRCGNDIEAPAPDPCASVKPASARFNVHVSVAAVYDTVWDYSFGCDTLFSSSAIFMAADTLNQTYKWTLGSETFTSRNFSRSQFPQRQPITVSLKTVRKDKDTCLLPNEKADSATHTLFFDRNQTLLGKTRVNGRFRGYRNGNPADTATLTYLVDTLSRRLTQSYLGSTTYGNFWPGTYYCHWGVGNDFQRQYRQVAFGISRVEAKAPAQQGTEGLYSISDTVAITYYGRGTVDFSGTAKFQYWAVRVVAARPKEWESPWKKREARYYTFTGKWIPGI